MAAIPQNWLSANQSKAQPSGRSPSAMMSELTAPYWPKICLIPIAPTKGGKIIGTRTNEDSSPLPGNTKRSEIKARGSAISIASPVVAQASKKELHSPPR